MMFAALTFRGVYRISEQGKGSLWPSGLLADWNVTRIVICALLGVPLLLGARWVCETMDLGMDDYYEFRGRMIVYMVALLLAVVVSGLVSEALARPT